MDKPHDRIYLSDETYTVTREGVNVNTGDVRYRAVSPKHTFERADIVAAPDAHANSHHAAVILDMKK